MHQSAEILGRGLLILGAVGLFAALPACAPQPESTGASTSTSERAELARRLGLSPDRFNAIQTGGQTPIVTRFDAGQDCTDGYCTCTGDDDCNDMFSGICSDPATGGICQIRDNVPRCRCKDPRAR